MAKKVLTKQEQAKHDKDYLAFLEKQVGSANFKKNVSEEEFNKAKAKLDKARLKAKLLK